MIGLSVAGAVQMLYCLVVGTFPFNSFLAGFISCVSSFVLAVSLRIQCNPENASVFSAYAGGDANDTAPTKRLMPERAFADFLFAHLVLHLVVFNFLGWVWLSRVLLMRVPLLPQRESFRTLTLCLHHLFHSRLAPVFGDFYCSFCIFLHLSEWMHWTFSQINIKFALFSIVLLIKILEFINFSKKFKILKKSTATGNCLRYLSYLRITLIV